MTRSLASRRGDLVTLVILALARLLIQCVTDWQYGFHRDELATLDDRARKHTLIALEALTDFESWGRMRELYGLSVEQGCDLWIRIIDRILPPTPAR